jgi:hypothetical protein
MKKVILLIFGFLLIAGYTGAQVIERFDKPGSLGIFKDANWGTAANPSITDSIYQTTDPTGKSTGVMAVDFNFKGYGQHNAIISLSTLDPKGAHQITYWIYIPANSGIPDKMQFGLWWQVNGNWTWNEYKYFAKDIPKGVWYPLSVAILDSSIADPTNDGFINGHILGNYGIQWNNDSTTSSVWKGTVYIDNVSLVGVKPTDFATFSTGLQSFGEQWPNGWVDSVKYNSGPVGDSMGVAEWKLIDGSASTGGVAFGIQPSPSYSASTQSFVAFWIYLDPSFPDTAHIQTWAQDNHFWNMPNPVGMIDYLGKNIPKNKWYPLYVDLSQAGVLDSLTFNPKIYPIGKFGVQIYNTKTWTGSIYFRRVQFIDTIVAVVNNKSWVAADFENITNGIQAFHAVSGNAPGTLARTLSKQSPNTSYVLQASIDFSGKKNFIMERDSVPLIDATDASLYATDVSINVFFPGNMPLGGGLDLVITGPAAKNGWLQVDGQIDNSALKLNQWNTITLNLTPLVLSGSLNPLKPATVAVQVYYPPTDTTTWGGKVLFDNLVFSGISRPKELPTPVLNNKNAVKEFKLYNNYPNPFNPSTVIQYDIPRELNVTLRVYDVLGREVTTLVNNQKQVGGSYSVTFDASKFASGVYIYKIIAGGYVKSYKMMLIK